MTQLRLAVITDVTPKQLPEIVDNFQKIENVIDAQISDDNILPGGLSRVSFSDDVPRSVAGQYTGDGTANRIITLGWMPRRIVILSSTDLITFESICDGTTQLASWWRTSTGALNSGLADWGGSAATGIKLGTGLANLSNKNGQIYTYWALR